MKDLYYSFYKISFLRLHFILHFPKDNLIVYGYVNFFSEGRYL